MQRKHDSLILINGLTFSYKSNGKNGKQVLSQLSVKIPLRGITSIIGRSGCGKTTLLKILGGRIPYENGRIDFVIDSRKISHENFLVDNNIGYLPQSSSLLPWKNIKANLALIYSLQKMYWASEKSFWDYAKFLLKRMHIDDILHLMPGELSGGMQQRVLIVRAFLNRPFSSLLLLDEPFGSIDPLTKQSIQNDTVSLIKEEQTKAIIVTHDLNQAINMSNQIIILPNNFRDKVQSFIMKDMTSSLCFNQLISLINPKGKN